MPLTRPCTETLVDEASRRRIEAAGFRWALRLHVAADVRLVDIVRETDRHAVARTAQAKETTP